eukprot:Skav231105  [mRNA]  locus=scaffold2525:459335:462529:+ [translate_table: standard]
METVQKKWLPSVPVLRKEKSKRHLKTLPVTAETLLLKNRTWLGFRKNKKDNQWGAGCEICAFCNDGRARAFRTFSVTKLKLDHLKRRQRTVFHKENLRKMMGMSGTVQAPPQSQFLAVWDEIMKGVSPHSVGVDNMGGKKIFRMMFCLAEALYREDRQFAKQAVCGSIRRDESDGRLLLYFTFVTKDLRTRSGTLGIRKKFGSGADALTCATIELFKRFATANSGVQDFLQAKDSQPPLSMDKGLWKHALECQRQTIIDAAADEQLSTRQMMDMTLPGSEEKAFPNLKLLTLDHSHATTRILKRGFAAVPALQAIIREDIQSKSSITQMIDNSKLFRNQFEKHGRSASTMNLGAQSSMSAAKHRFASLQKPLMRSILRYDALMATAGWIYHVRKGTAKSKNAFAFLEKQTSERLLLRAMMADACEETIVLLRFGDQNRLEVATLPREIAAWQSRTKLLFVDGKCKDYGFTNFMITELQNTRMVPVTAKAIGGWSDGVPDNVFQKCLCIMQQWLKIAQEIIDAEFPNFRLLYAFKVFDLDLSEKLGQVGHSARAAGRQMRQSVEDHVATLAKFYNVSLPELSEELRQLKPLCQEEMQDTGCSCQESWRRVVAHRHGFASLKRLLVEYLALDGSTSVVERSFGKTRKAISDQQGSLSEFKENVLTKLLLDRPALPAEVDHITDVARQVWGTWFGIPRKSSSKKRRRLKKKRSYDDDNDNGNDKPKRRKMISEIDFLRQRRSEIDGAVKDNEGQAKNTVLKVKLGKAGMKELKFQRQKKFKQMVDAYNQGVLDQRHVSPAFRKKLAQHVEQERSRDRTRKQKAKRAHALLTSDGKALTRQQVSDMGIFLEKDAGASARAWCKVSRCPPKKHRTLAQVFVGRSPELLGQRSKMVAVLVGGFVVTEASLSLGKTGFKSASIGLFKKNHKALHFIMQRCLRHAGTRCKFVQTPKATGRTIPLVALVCNDELKTDDVLEIKRGKNHTVFTAKGFIDNFWSIDPLKSLSGVCDM